jgi:hypothetical protein
MAALSLAATTASALCTSLSAGTIRCSGRIRGGYLARTSQSRIDTNNLTDTNPNAPGGINLLSRLVVDIDRGAYLSPNHAVQLWTTNDQTGVIATPIITASVAINDNSTINNRGTIQNGDGRRAKNIAVQLGGDGATLVNRTGGVVSAAIGARNLAHPGALAGPANTYAYNSAVIAVNTELHGSNRVENHGLVHARHAGVGVVWAVAAGGKSDAMSIDNYGTISAARTQPLFVTTTTPSELLGTVSVGSASNGINHSEPSRIGYAAGIFSEEELITVTIHNHAGATIEASGDLTAALYQRANELHITNDGIIRYRNGAGQMGGVALTSYEAPFNEVDDGTLQIIVGNTTLTNTGRIIGDVRMIDVNGLLDMASEAGVYDKALLTIAGRRDSLIENSGTMQNIVLGAGSHKVANSGTIAGSIRVNQDVIYNYSSTNSTRNYPSGTFSSGQPATSCVAPGVPLPGCLPSRFYLAGDTEHGYDTEADFLAAHPDKRLVLENSGTVAGDLTITTAQGSHNTLSPIITGAGTGSSLDAPSRNIGLIQGTLKIITASGATTATTTAVIKPIVTSPALVRTGQYYLIAQQFYGDALPEVEGSGYIAWTAHKTRTGALVISATVTSQVTP